MAARFQIREFDSDPFDEEEQRAGGQRSEGESDSGNVEQHLGAARGRRVEAPETVDFEAAVPVARRMTLPEEELLDDVSMFRGRTRSEPPNFWLAVQYGRELRRMSDEFLSTYSENQRIHVSRSAGAIMGTVYRKIVCYLPGKGSVESQKSDNC